MPARASSWPRTNGTRRNTSSLVASPSLPGQIAAEQARVLDDVITDLVENRVIEVIPRAVYDHLEPASRRRVPPSLSLSALPYSPATALPRRGIPTWTVETLRAELDQT